MPTTLSDQSDHETALQLTSEYERHATDVLLQMTSNTRRYSSR